jgi:hypothetical protein
VKTADDRWDAVVKARFTADRNPVINIDAGVRGDRFFLVTGGATENKGAKLNGPIDLPAGPRRVVPEDLPGSPGPRRQRHSSGDSGPGE